MSNTMNQENIEEQILQAAFDVFVEKGYENTKMQDIADKAGIKRTVLNYYFRTKDLLYQKIAKTIMKQALPLMLKILNSDMPFEEKIAAYVDNYINIGMKNPFLPSFIINELNSLGPKFIENILDGNSPDITPFIKHVNSEIEKGRIINTNPIQILIHVVSLCAFPIIAKPLVKLMTGIDEKQFNKLMEERKKEVTELVLKGIKL